MFKFFQSDILLTYKHEIFLFLNSLIFKYSIYKNKSTPGNHLQNLKLVDKTGKSLHLHQKMNYWLLFIFGRYIWKKFINYISDWGYMSEQDNDISNETNNTTFKRQIYHISHKLESYYKIATLINFLIFLIHGKYRNLIERILSIKLAYIKSNFNRQISYDFMTQQLLWHGLSEFMLFILPLINFKGIIQFFKSIFQNNINHTSNIISNKCPICHNNPINMPYKSSCSHIFCYYCLYSQIKYHQNNNIKYICPTCHSIIENMEQCI